MYPIPSRDLSCPIWFINLFRSNECCDEAVGYVLGPISGDPILVDEVDGVGAGVASRHALGKSANLVFVRLRPYCSSFTVGELLVRPPLPMTLQLGLFSKY